MIVVGDKKTPADWNFKNCTYLGINDQLELARSLAEIIPFNHYGRKMLGYVYAIRNGAEVIINTDDDNIPYDDWGFPSFAGHYNCSDEDLGWVNIYGQFTSQTIWPRGLSLRNIRKNDSQFKLNPNVENLSVGIWQGLADEDPDVDAIYRLTSNAPCYFDKRPPFILGKGTITPFNSQNTAFQKKFFPLLFLPSYVTFRFTDILRGIIAQPILWKENHMLGFLPATVIQKRNAHDYFKDFISEVPIYLHSETIYETVAKSIGNNPVAGNLFNAYEALLQAGIVEKREMDVLNEWLKIV